MNSIEQLTILVAGALANPNVGDTQKALILAQHAQNLINTGTQAGIDAAIAAREANIPNGALLDDTDKY